MSKQARLAKLEADEKRALRHELRLLELRLTKNWTERERFVAVLAMMMLDDELREADDDEQENIIKRRQQSASVADLRQRIAVLQWAIEELEAYETEHQNID